MKVFKSLKQGLLQRTFEKDSRFFLSVSLNSFFSFSSATSTILPETDFWPYAAKILGTDMILDAGMPKSRGEVLLTGSFFAREGVPVPSGQVRFSLGPVTKQLWVCGDRFWKKLGDTAFDISTPKPITTMEISYRNAYGGPDYPRNPLGKGHWPDKDPTPPQLYHLPNIELPQHLIRSPKEFPEPAGFGPLDLTWPQRASKMGTYGDAWLQERFPGYAQDMDWSFFNMAPEDQHLNGFFTGNEIFTIENMHPEQPVLEGKLPAIKARCFVNQLKNDTEVFQEIATTLDTIWLFPKDRKGLLIFRGVLEIEDSDADDILHIMIAYESQKDTPRSFDHFQQAFRNRTDSQKGLLYLINDKDLIPEGERSGFAELIAGTAGESQKSEGLLRKNLLKRAEREKEKAKNTLEKYGLNPETTWPASPLESLDFSLENIDQFADNIGIALQEAEKEKIQGQEKLKNQFAELGLDYDKMVAEAKEKGGGRPTIDPQETIDLLAQVGIHDPDFEKRLFATKEKMDQAYRQYGHHFPPGKLPEKEARFVLRNTLIAELKENKSLSGRDFSGADLSHLDLTGSDFSDTFLEGVDFTDSILDKVNLSGCVLTYSLLDGARFAAATLQKANLGHAQCANTDFSGSDLTGAVFYKATLDGTRFKASSLVEADFSEATIRQASFANASMVKAQFLESRITTTSFTDANCQEVMFLNCPTFDQVDFTRANLSAATFVGIKGTDLKFINARLNNLRTAMETSFANADFSGATLNEGNLREANLAGAIFHQADLSKTDFSKCKAQGADFSFARAPNAQFVKADLSQAKMTGINLFEGSLQKACLHETNLQGANLYGADFIRARFRNTDLGGANLQNVFLDRWIHHDR